MTWFSDHDLQWLGTLISIVALVVGAVLLRWFALKMIDRVTERLAANAVRQSRARGIVDTSTLTAERRQQRFRTLASVLKNITTALLGTIVTLMVISALGYNIVPLIASVGIIGIALGLGAQGLVSDYLAGMSILLEDQFGVGDFVDLGEASGGVEAVSLRITRLRDVDGTVWYVRNGQIQRVGNQSQNWARTVVDIPVPHSADLSAVKVTLQEAAHAVWQDEEFRPRILEEPELWGVESLDPGAVLMRVVVKTAPGEQWGIARQMRERIKLALEEIGVQIPDSHRLVIRHRGEVDVDGEPAESADQD